ncbi:MAG: type II secretion system protein GspM [Methylococcales bacterium]|nr:type II secretion system protein GspM [Methylococcales bacterium]
MLQTLSKLQQRSLAVGLLLGVIALILALVVWPWYTQVTDAQQQIKDLVFRIQRYTRVIEGRNEVLEKVSQSKQGLDALGYFYEQSSPALASAELQAFIKNIIVSAGGVLESTQVLPQVEEDDLIHIAVNVRLTGDIPLLRSILYQIETTKPLKLVEELDLRPIRGVRNRMTGQLEDMGTVSINLQVAGYMRKAQ